MDQRTENLLRQFLQSLDCEFVGIQSGKVVEIGDSLTKATYGFYLSGLTTEAIVGHIQAKRREFLEKEEPNVAA